MLIVIQRYNRERKKKKEGNITQNGIFHALPNTYPYTYTCTYIHLYTSHRPSVKCENGCKFWSV